MHLYVFGSAFRGEADLHSDIDLLLITNKNPKLFDSSKYSIYTYERIESLWEEGNPFAWHLFWESELIFTTDKNDFIELLGTPASYKKCYADCYKFYEVFLSSKVSICESKSSLVFDFSTIFLCMRNVAICYSLGFKKQPVFSRRAATMIGLDSISIPDKVLKILELSRIAATRGVNFELTEKDINMVELSINSIDIWIQRVLNLIRNNINE